AILRPGCAERKNPSASDGDERVGRGLWLLTSSPAHPPHPVGEIGLTSHLPTSTPVPSHHGIVPNPFSLSLSQ
ncbi:unnamed protein product, partial [Musa acuminata subsp. burmannicoides]